MQVLLGQPGVVIQRGGRNSKLVQVEEVQQQVPLSNQIQVQQRDLRDWPVCATVTVYHAYCVARSGEYQSVAGTSAPECELELPTASNLCSRLVVINYPIRIQ